MPARKGNGVTVTLEGARQGRPKPAAAAGSVTVTIDKQRRKEVSESLPDRRMNRSPRDLLMRWLLRCARCQTSARGKGAAAGRGRRQGRKGQQAAAAAAREQAEPRVTAAFG